MLSVLFLVPFLMKPKFFSLLSFSFYCTLNKRFLGPVVDETEISWLS